MRRRTFRPRSFETREVSVRFGIDPRFEEPKDLNFERKQEVLDRAGRIADRRVSFGASQDSQSVAERASGSEVQGWSLANVPARPYLRNRIGFPGLHLAEWLLGNGAGRFLDSCGEGTEQGIYSAVGRPIQGCTKSVRHSVWNASGIVRFGQETECLENEGLTTVVERLR